MKHLFAEILAHFKAHNHTNLEAAQQAVYDLGHERGRDDAKAEFAAGLGDTSPKAPTGATSDEDKKGAKAQTGKGPSTEDEAPAGAET